MKRGVTASDTSILGPAISLHQGRYELEIFHKHHSGGQEKECGDNHDDVDDVYNIDDDASSSMTSATPGKQKRRRQQRGG